MMYFGCKSGRLEGCYETDRDPDLAEIILLASAELTPYPADAPSVVECHEKQ